MVDAWAIDSSGGTPSYSGYDLRMGTVLPFVAGAGSAVGVRTGVRPSGSGTDLLVQAQASPNMSVLVNPGAIIAQGTYTATQGPYTWALDTQTTLTIANSHATLDRTDLVCVRIRDSNVDSSGARDGSVMVVTGTPGSGTPALPTDATYVVIAQISVVHAVTSITSGAITDKRPFTAAVGGIIPCNSSTEPAAGTVAAGQGVYRTDLIQLKISDGATYRQWLGLLAYGNRASTSLSTTGEVGVLRLDNLPVVNGHSYRVATAPLILLSNIDGDVVGARFRSSTSGAATTSSTQVGNAVSQVANSAHPYATPLTAKYDATATGTLSVLLTVNRVSGTGNASLFLGCEMWIEDLGPTATNTGVVI